MRLEEALTKTWSAMIGMKLEKTTGPSNTLDGACVGCVSVSGGWRGDLVLSVSGSLARKVTGAMLGMPDEELESEMVKDAVGEVANITAGNLAKAAEAPCELSTPFVMFSRSTVIGAGISPGASMNDTALLGRLCFECVGEPVVVALYANDGE